MLAVARGGWLDLDSLGAARARGAVSGRPGPFLETSRGDRPETAYPVLGPTERRVEARGAGLDETLQAVAAVFEGVRAGASPSWTSEDALYGAGPPTPSGSASEIQRSVFSDPSAFAFFLVGPDPPDVVEAYAGRTLAPLRAAPGLRFAERRASRPAQTPPPAGAPSSVALRAAVEADDAPALALLRVAVERRMGVPVEAAHVPRTGTGWLRVTAGAETDAEAALRSSLASVGADLDAARQQLRDESAADPVSVWLEALAAFYERGDARQPVRNPARLDARPPPVADGAVRALARRFATTADRAVTPVND